MIVLTVKTLDSQNHTFTVDDDITVEEFKAKIADTVNIPADTQRIIYCGRVLQDSSKLSDYDVNGKVVHLVQRPPPSQNPPTTRSASPQPPRRGFRGFDTENTMYLGSMAFPSNLMESQGIVPPPPSHSLAGSRLNVAKRMLRRADAVISLLENPSARPNDQGNSEEQQEEEVTPIIEARVIVPPGSNESIDEAMVLSAVQNTLFDAASGSIPISGQTSGEGGSATQETTETFSAEPSASSTPEERVSPGESSSGDQRNSAASARILAENASRTTEMAELLATLNQLQNRFAPFLERYRQFMAEDPIISQENVRQTQTMLSRVSEVLHFLGHAYHSLSDIIIRVRMPPPRPLLCRPILIQHSAVVQTGIPIQVEVAQFNLSATTGSSTSTTDTPTTATATTTTQAPPSAPPAGVNLRGFPFIPGASMRVQSFPIEVRASSRPASAVPASQRAQNNNNNTVTTEANVNSTNDGTTTTTTTTAAGPGFNVPNFNNSSVEFFMEVTPEVLQGTLNGPPPEFLQSLIQMAGQIMNRITTTAPTSDTTTTTMTTSSSSNTTDSAPSNQQQGQNTQARGNTQTNPTTATHTRSTPRPHVHLAQQAMQGGFDPFLPCNSHHVTHRRRPQQAPGVARPAGANQNQNAGEETSEPRDRPPAPQSLQNAFEEISSWLRSSGRWTGNVGGSPTPSAPVVAAQAGVAVGREPSVNVSSSSTSAPGSQIPTVPPHMANFLSNILPNLQGALANLPAMLNGPTIADILQQLPNDDGPDSDGNSLITDLIMLLSRNLTIVDVVTLNTGNFTPLNRVTNEIQNFFNTRVLEGSASPEAVNRGVDRFISEMQPFFQNFNRLRVCDDIDLVRSIENLFRRRLPDIITMAASLNADNTRNLVDRCLMLAKMMCAVALRASANGQSGVEETFQQIVASYVQDIPTEIQSWTTVTSCANLRHFMMNLGVNEAEIEPYLVRTGNLVAAETVPQPDAAEPMELEEEEVAQPSLPSLSLGEDAEPLPNVMLGSEPWHGQVPEDWVPIITRDVQRQRRQNSQPPFSDAYLSGMPTKRRKIVNGNKPHGSLPQVIADSVRRAVTATGLTSAAPLENVAQAAGDSSDIQSAYRSLLRSTVHNALRDNEEFTPERFPNASAYFKPQ